MTYFTRRHTKPIYQLNVVAVGVDNALVRTLQTRFHHLGFGTKVPSGEEIKQPTVYWNFVYKTTISLDVDKGRR